VAKRSNDSSRDHLAEIHVAEINASPDRSDCHPGDTVLLDYSSGKLDESASTAIDQHLEQCAACCDRLMRMTVESSDDEPMIARLRAAGQIVLTFENGRRIGEYRLIRVIGQGGMGIVYEAYQESLRRRVALKILPMIAAHDAEAIRRFRREACAAANLHHTNIVPVYEIGETEECQYFAMQLISGRSLAQLYAELRESEDKGVEETDAIEAELDQDLRARSIAHMGYQAASALAHAHARGVIHRDIKPSNLLLDDEGVVWVVDFGLAKFNDDDLTQTGQLLGTLRYLAPERFRGEADERCDIYALGVSLYELLVRQRLFQSTSHPESIQHILHQTPPPPRRIDPSIPRDLETVVLKAIAKDPDRRYQTAADMADDLLRFCDQENILARRQRPLERFSGVVRHTLFSSGLRSIAAVIFVLSVGGLGGLTARLLESNRYLILVAKEQSTIADHALLSLGQAEHAVHEMREYWADRRVSEAISAVDAGDITVALHAIVDAIEYEPDPQVEKLHRTRLAILLRHIASPIKSWRLDAPIRLLEFSADGSAVTAVSSRGSVVVLPIDDRSRTSPAVSEIRPFGAAELERLAIEKTRLIAVHSKPKAIATSHDGAHVMAGFEDGLVRLFESPSIGPVAGIVDTSQVSKETPSLAEASQGDRELPTFSRWQSDRWKAVLESGDGAASVLRMIDNAGQPLRPPVEIAGKITAGVVCGNADCVVLASADYDTPGDAVHRGGVVRIYRFADSPPDTLAYQSPVKCLEWCDAGQTLIVVCEGGTIELVSILDRPRRGIKVDAGCEVCGVAYDRTLGFLATGGVTGDGKPLAQIWETTGGQPLTHRISLRAQVSQIELIAQSPAAKFHFVDGGCQALNLAPIEHPLAELRTIAELYSGTRQSPRGGEESLSIGELVKGERELKRLLPALNRPLGVSPERSLRGIDACQESGRAGLLTIDSRLSE